VVTSDLTARDERSTSIQLIKLRNPDASGLQANPDLSGFGGTSLKAIEFDYFQLALVF
jgi:hypothetical protein